MKNSKPEQIRNFVLAGHFGCGKTTLSDLMLYKSGQVNRLGKVEQKTSVSDFRPEEHEKQSSIYSAFMNCSWDGNHFFFVDTPGYPDFFGETKSAISQADAVLLVVDASAGLDVGTARAWKAAAESNIPRAFFINCMDREQADFPGVLQSIQENYGATSCIPVTVPVGGGDSFSSVLHVLRDTEIPDDQSEAVAKYKEALMDTIAESDEELMNKYLEGEELTEAEISKGLHEAIINADIVPVFVGSAAEDIGIEQLMNGIGNLFPSPLMGAAVKAEEGEIAREAEDDGKGFVFKTISDPFIGQLTLMRVYSGVFKSDSEVHNVNKHAKERVGSLLHLNGKEQVQTETAGPGEIVAVAKLKHTGINDTLAVKSDAKAIAPMEFPQPTLSYAVYAVNSGEEEKIGAGIGRLADEDPTIKFERNKETQESILSGMGDQHIQNVVQRLRESFKVEVDLRTPKVPYRETITATGTAVYRHKKQSGGHGQFAEVHLRLEPLVSEENFEFANEVVGGNIPKNFIPAVEKGVVEAMEKGPLAGCRVINIKAVVFDGKHHPVDSSEMAFKIASRYAFREAMRGAKPQLLEPIMSLRIMFPEEYMGDISGDLNSRRGRIQGMSREEGMQVVNAEVPLAEVFSYPSQLRSITQGRGTFEMSFERYEQVPSNIARQVQEQAAKEQEEE